MTNSTDTTDKKLRIGILGGTFDPIHNGHIAPAKEVFNTFLLDKILVIPAHKPPHKNGTKASAEHRVHMTKLICNVEQDFELDTREINRSSLSYTVDTLKEIKDEYPNSQVFFIMGMDSLLNFTHWHLWQNILLYCHLIVNTRPGYDLSVLNTETQQLLTEYQNKTLPINNNAQNKSAKKSGYIYLHPAKEIDISSTQIRQNIANNKECAQWLPNDIIQYINKHQLYR